MIWIREKADSLKQKRPTCIHHVWCLTLCPFQWCSQAAGRQLFRRSHLYWCRRPVTGHSTGPGQNQISETGRDQIRPSNWATMWHWWLSWPADYDRQLSSYYVHSVVWWGQHSHVPACRRGEAFHVCVKGAHPHRGRFNRRWINPVWTGPGEVFTSPC